MESKLEDQVRDAFKGRLDGVRGEVIEPQRVVSRVVRRRIGNTLAASVAVVAVALSIFLAPRIWETAKQPGVAAAEPASGGPQVAPPDSPGKAVASGQQEGRPWTLYGYATNTPSAGNGTAGDFCHAFRFGGELPGADYACGLGENTALVPPQYIDPVWMTPEHGPEVFYGKVSPAADSIKIEIPDRQTLPARIYDSPPEWAAPYSLFVGFAPPGTEAVTLVVRDAQGNELERRTIQNAPPSP